jgi:hypothetical protein
MSATPEPLFWRTNADGSLACPHRDLSVCPLCAAHPDVYDIAGAHYHLTTAEAAIVLEGLL